MSRGSNPMKVQQWSDRFERFESSGQTVVQFCVAEGVSQPSFYQWRKKLGVGARVRRGSSKRSGSPLRVAGADRGSKNKSVFRQVQLTSTPSVQQCATIRLADGVDIELGNNLQVVDMVVRSVVKQLLSDGATREGGSSC